VRANAGSNNSLRITAPLQLSFISFQFPTARTEN
jgi:hypothetical protein